MNASSPPSGRLTKVSGAPLTFQRPEDCRLTVKAEPIHNLFTGDVDAMELRLRSSDTAELSTAAMLAAVFQAGGLDALDLAYMRRRLDAVADYPLPVAAHINLFPQTLLGRRFDSVLHTLQRRARGRRVVLGLSVQGLPLADPRLAERVAALRAHGVSLELLEMEPNSHAIRAAMQLRPRFVRLSGDLVATCERLGDQECARAQRLFSALGASVIADGVDTAAIASAMRGVGVTRGLGRASRPERPDAG